MTDNEIIKALECHASDAEFCKLCPLTNEEWCSVKLARNTLDLINRKDSKIAELTEENNHQQAEIEKLQMMIDSDNEVCTECHCEYMDKVHQARIEAIKEFAERLTDRADLVKVNDFDSKYAISQDDIDNLVKEMVGDTE